VQAKKKPQKPQAREQKRKPQLFLKQPLDLKSVAHPLYLSSYV